MSKKIYMKYPPKKSCDLDNFRPGRDATLRYSPLDGLHGPVGLVFMQLLGQEQRIFVCLLLLLYVEINNTLSSFG